MDYFTAPHLIKVSVIVMDRTSQALGLSLSANLRGLFIES